MQTQDGTFGGRYLHFKELGAGAFGTVFKSADTKNNGRLVAVKAICTGKGPAAMISLRSSLDEAKTLADLRHPNIVGWENFYLFSDGGELVICLVTEFCGGGSLDSYLCIHGNVGEFVAMKLMRQLATGLQYLHGKGLSHRDLKPDNILLDTSNNVKIADFGLAKAAWDIRISLTSSGMSFGAYMTSCNGTPAFMAPEVYNNHYTESADTFSLGLLCVCITHATTFKRYLPRDSRYAILPLANGKTTPLGALLHGSPIVRSQSACSLLGIGASLRPALRRLFDSMLQFSYGSRPCVSNILESLESINSQPLPITLDTAKPFENSGGGACGCG